MNVNVNEWVERIDKKPLAFIATFNMLLFLFMLFKYEAKSDMVQEVEEKRVQDLKELHDGNLTTINTQIKLSLTRDTLDQYKEHEIMDLKSQLQKIKP